MPLYALMGDLSVFQNSQDIKKLIFILSNLRLATRFEKGWGEREKNPDERKLK